MNKFYKENALKIFGAVTFALTLICTVLSTLSRTMFFDEIGYYQADAIIPKVFIAICACSVLAICVFCFVPKLRIEAGAISSPLPVRIGALALAAGFALLTLESVNTLTVITSEYNIVWDLEAVSYLILPLVIRLLATVHFIRAAIVKDQSGVFNVIGNTCVIIFAVSAIASTYFDAHIPMNSPNVTLLYLALLSTMLLCVNEARIGLGDDKTALHAFCAAIATLFGTSFCISEAFVYFELLNDPHALESTITVNSYYSIIFFISVFAATRLASICFIKPAPIEEQNDDQQTADEQIADEQIADEQITEETEASEDVNDTQADTE